MRPRGSSRAGGHNTWAGLSIVPVHARFTSVVFSAALIYLSLTLFGGVATSGKDAWLRRPVSLGFGTFATTSAAFLSVIPATEVPANHTIVLQRSAPHRDFCAKPTATLEPIKGSADAVWLDSHHFDLVNEWPLQRKAALEDAVTCFWAMQHASRIHLLPIPLCAHDPQVDRTISPELLQTGWWGDTLEHEFMLSAGSTGTPLNASTSQALRAAAAAGATAPAATLESGSSEQGLVKSLGPPGAVSTQSACTRERPVTLDVGGNIGLFAVAAGAYGCTVLVVEPLTTNVGRLWHTVKRNGWEDRVLLFKHAVSHSAARVLVTMDFSVAKHGQAKLGAAHGVLRSVRRENVTAFPRGVSGRETVATLDLADLFFGDAQDRPKHPFLPRPIAPTDLASIKIDVEGYDAVALYGLRSVVEEGLPPLIKVEFLDVIVASSSASKRPGDCSAIELLKWLYGLGYQAYTPGVRRSLKLSEWEDYIVPLLASGRIEELQSLHGIPRISELFAVHESAPVPAVLVPKSTPKSTPKK